MTTRTVLRPLAACLATAEGVTPGGGLERWCRATYDTSPAVTSTGTLYWDRSSSHCGRNVQLMEKMRFGGVVPLNTFSNGIDIGALQTYNDGTNDQVFYTRFVCSTNGQDIYRVTR